MRSEPFSTRSSYETTPPAPHDPPHDPPAPAPQAAAWRRALKVIGCAPPVRQVRVVKTTVRRGEWRQ